MAKQEPIKTSGEVNEVLPNSQYRVELENEHVVLCHLSGKMKMNNINILPGDLVDIEMSPYDMDRGRITYRHSN